MIYTFLYYTFFSSAVLIYGIGLNTSTIICDSVHYMFLPLIKILFSVVSSAVLTWLIIKEVLVPLGLCALYPIFAMLIFMGLSVFIESIIRISTGRITSDFNFSFLITILALNESVRLWDVVLVSISAITSFALLLPVIYSVKSRIDIVGNIQLHGNRKSLVLISIGVIIVALEVANVSWLNTGVIR